MSFIIRTIFLSMLLLWESSGNTNITDISPHVKTIEPGQFYKCALALEGTPKDMPPLYFYTIRINDKTRPKITEYIDKQLTHINQYKKLTQIPKYKAMYGLYDGAIFADMSLRSVPFSAAHFFGFIATQDFSSPEHIDWKKILIYVTVIAPREEAENPVLTTHVGITSDVGAAEVKILENKSPFPPLSMLLHKKLAETMILFQPKLQYQVNGPAPAMEKIIMQTFSAQEGLYIETVETRKEMEEAYQKGMEVFYDDECKFWQRRLEKVRQEHPHLSMEEIKKVLQDKEHLPFYLKLNDETQSIGLCSRNDHILYEAIILPGNMQKMRDSFQLSTADFYKLLQKFPPILQFIKDEKRHRNTRLFDPKYPGDVEKALYASFKDHPWMDLEVFHPVLTDMCAINIRALSHCNPFPTKKD